MTNSEKIKILFFGELPPNVVHGVSISNKINTDILKELGELTVIEEEWDLSVHGHFSMKKVVSVLKSVNEIWKLAGKKNHHLYYSVLSVSLFGALKQILFVLAIKIRNKNTALLYHVHRSDLKRIMDQSFSFRTYVSWLNRMQAEFILLSKMQKRECEGLIDKAYVLYNCIDEQSVYPMEIDREPELVRFLYLSNYMKEKGILDLLNAFRQIEEEFPIQLDCYGGDTNEQVKKDINEIAQNDKRIFIHGAVYGEKKNKVLNSADILILPSYNEGLPLVVIEALRVNKPVIVTKVGYLQELLGDHYPLYCKAGDLQSIKNAIKKAISLLRSESLKEALSDCYTNVSLEKHSQQLKDIVMTNFQKKASV